MLRIAGPNEAPQEASVELCRVLHPSSGLPGRLALALVDELPVTGPIPAREGPLAEVVPLRPATVRRARRPRSGRR